MSAVCEVCNKKPHFSMQVSFSHKRSKRRWDPNIQRIRIWENGGSRRARVCTSCLKAGKVQRPPQRTAEQKAAAPKAAAPKAAKGA